MRKRQSPGKERRSYFATFALGNRGTLLLLAIVTTTTAFYAARAGGVLASNPAGVASTTLLGNSDSFVSIPFTRPAEFAGQIQSISGNVITVKGSPAWANNQFVYAAGTQKKHYYVLIGSSQATNPKEGHTYSVTANTSNTLTVDTTQDSLSGIPTGTPITLIPHWTLATVFPTTDQNASFTPTTTTATYKTQILIPSYTTITSTYSSGSGNETVPEGATQLVVEAYGGGGGGSVRSASQGGGKGGGGGSYVQKSLPILSSDWGRNIAYTVGAGGARGGSSAGNGGASTVSNLTLTSGTLNLTTGTASGGTSTNGSGAVPTGGDTNTTGSSGSGIPGGTAAVPAGGAGGVSAGISGAGPGGGGAGAYFGYGGYGAAGSVTFTWTYSPTYFFSNNVNGTTGNVGWRVVGNNTANHGDDILLPGSFFIVRNANNAPTLTLVTLGRALTEKFVLSLLTATGGQKDNGVSVIRPFNTPLNATGLGPSNASFIANDQLLVFDNSQVGFNKSPSATYYYNTALGNTGGWRLTGNATSDRGGDVIPIGTGFVIRKAATSGGQPVLWTNSSSVRALRAVSRKTHGSLPGVDFDVDLPLAGPPGIECRHGGATNDYKLVITFPAAITFSNASLTTGTGYGYISTVTGTGTTTVTVNLSGITNAQWITVTLVGVTDGVNTNDVAVRMGVLAGDTTVDKFVDSADINQVKSQAGNAVANSNFREDLNADGFIDSADISLVKSYSGTALP